MTQFEDKFMEVQASMISLAMEYVQNQAEKVYIDAIADRLYSFNLFYKIKGNIVHKHLVNDFLPTKSHIDTSLQSLLLKEGVKDVKSMLDVCQEYNREHPTEMWLIYDAKKNSLDSRYSYEGRYDKDEELLPSLEFEMLLILALNIQLSAFSQRAGGQGTTSTGFAKRVEDLLKISEKSRAYYLKNKWKE